MMMTTVIILSVLSAVLAVVMVIFIVKNSVAQSKIDSVKAQYETQIESQKTQFENQLESQKTKYEAIIEDKEKLHKEQKEDHEKAIETLKNTHKENLETQIKAIKAEMTVQTEQLLKQREEALNKKAEETFTKLSGNIDDNLKKMQTAFEENKEKTTKEAAFFKAQFENAVKNLAEQSKNIGNKADNLADAMRGQKKIQGCWGETILYNLLRDEGFVEGRDFDQEVTLRTSDGVVIKNEDTDKKMRPDFILHFVNNQDVIVDAKVSLNAYVKYYEAKTDEERAAAAKENTKAIKEQVNRLVGKNYSEYLRPGRKMVEYVIMFVPNYPALQLAYEEDPNLWKEAFSKGVLITSEETILPFLRMINMAWRNVAQLKNQEQIIKSAQNMVDRVADFAKYMTKIGEKLNDAQKAYEDANDKLKNSGQSILVSAHKVLNLGVKSKKALPDIEGNFLPGIEEGSSPLVEDASSPELEDGDSQQ